MSASEIASAHADRVRTVSFKQPSQHTGGSSPGFTTEDNQMTMVQSDGESSSETDDSEATPPTQGEFECKVCGRVFDSIHKLRGHLSRTVHSKTYYEIQKKADPEKKSEPKRDDHPTQEAFDRALKKYITWMKTQLDEMADYQKFERFAEEKTDVVRKKLRAFKEETVNKIEGMERRMTEQWVEFEKRLKSLEVSKTAAEKRAAQIEAHLKQIESSGTATAPETEANLTEGVVYKCKLITRGGKRYERITLTRPL